MSSNIQQLGSIITLPHAPAAVHWAQTRTGEGGLGPTDYSILAILDYDDAICEQIVRQSPRLPGTDPAIVAREEVGDWMPSSVKSHFTQEKEGYFRVAGTPLDPVLFKRSPLLTGFVLRLPGTNQIVVALSTT